jgi:autotransporter translocation and assembly factor TamB
VNLQWKRSELFNWRLHHESLIKRTVRQIRPALRGKPNSRPTGVVD